MLQDTCGCRLSHSQLILEHPIRIEFKDFLLLKIQQKCRFKCDAIKMTLYTLSRRRRTNGHHSSSDTCQMKRNETNLQVLVSNSDSSSNKQSTKIGKFPWRLIIKIPIKIQLASYAFSLFPACLPCFCGCVWVLCVLCVDTSDLS